MIERKFWKASESFRMFFICFVVFMATSFLPYFIAGSETAQTPLFGWIVAGVASLSLVLAVFVCSKIFHVNFVSSVRINIKPNVKQILLGLEITFGIFIFMIPLVDMFSDFIVKLGFPSPQGTVINATPIEIISAVIVACLIASFTEEIFMRGAVAGGLVRYGKIGASLISGFAFMLFHMSPANTVYQFVFGFLLGFIYLTSGSIWVPIIMHLFNNSLAIVLSLTLPETLAVTVFSEYRYLTMIIGAVIVAVCLILFIKKTPNNFSEFLRNSEEGESVLEKPKLVDIAVFIIGCIFCAGMWMISLVSGA
ncbi:MAG TPA: type II CAAX endopeptidase family protein [Clostridia bacterium]|nr:type II CAAX endopeptidase family protein [Clostridia bacterium]